MAKKNKALKNLEKDVAKLRKRNDKLAKAIEKTREDQARAYQELHTLLEDRLPAHDAAPGEYNSDARDRNEKPEATDAATRRAEELGIDLSSARGTGAGGRVLVKDVEAAADAR